MYYGGVVVAGAFLVALSSWALGFYGPGVYLAALRDRHGWPVALVSSAVTLYYLCSAVWIAFVGDAIDRFGARRVVFFGACAMAAGVALLPAAQTPWHVYPAFLVMSFGWAAMSGAAVNAIVAPWFEQKRGLAISLALNGSSSGGVFGTPILVYLITAYGFGMGLHLAAAGMLALMIPVAILLRRPPGRASPPTTIGRWNRRAGVRDRRFVTIALPFALGLMAQVGFLTHQMVYLRQFLSPQSAAFAVSATTIAALAGRTVTGLFIDRTDQRVMAAANFALQIVALATLLLADSTATVYAGCVLYGLGVGTMITLPSLIVQHEFAPEDFSRIVSLIVSLNQFAFAFAPAILGALRDWSGGYDAPFAFCLALEVVAAGVVLAGRPPRPARVAVP